MNASADFGVAQSLYGSLSFRFRGTGFAISPPPSVDRAGPITLSRRARETAVVLCANCPETQAADTTYIQLPPGFALDAVLVYDRGLALVYPQWALMIVAGALLLGTLVVGGRANRSARRHQ